MITTQNAKRNNVETPEANRARLITQLRKKKEEHLEKLGEVILQAEKKYKDLRTKEAEEALKQALADRMEAVEELNSLKAIEASMKSGCGSGAEIGTEGAAKGL